MRSDLHQRVMEFLDDPSWAREVTLESVPLVLGKLEQVKALLWGRMLEGQNGGSRNEDRLLTIKEASERLGVTKDWLYRRANRLPFTRRLGARSLRFSAEGIQTYMRRRYGRGQGM